MNEGRDIMSLMNAASRTPPLEWFGELGYAHGHGPHVLPGELAAAWDSFGEVVQAGRVRAAIRRLKPTSVFISQD